MKHVQAFLSLILAVLFFSAFAWGACAVEQTPSANAASCGQSNAVKASAVNSDFRATDDPVPADQLCSIEIISKPSKLTYTVGDTLVISGIVVQATYGDGSKAVVSGWTCSPVILNTPGTQTITVSYKENGVRTTASFTVTVENPLVSIAVTSQPQKLTYTAGDTLDTTGITVKATYTDGTQADVTQKASYSPSVLRTPGTQTITVFYTENGTRKTAAFTVTVENPLQSIAVITGPAKQIYAVGESLNTTGTTVEAVYADGSRVNVTGWKCSPAVLDTVGTQTITVIYTENGITQTATFTVTVQNPPVSIVLTAEPTLQMYRVGDRLDTAGIAVQATYADGTQADVTNQVAYSHDVLTEEGTQNVTVSYTEDGVTLTATFSIWVSPADDSIHVTGIAFEFRDPINIYYKDKRTLCPVPTIYPADATNRTVTYTSDNPSTVSVSPDGTIRGVGRGDATVTATTEDGGFSASYRVHVSYSTWQWIVVILLFGWLWL